MDVRALPAWIYCRFSTLEQSKGDSLDRQLTSGRAFIERQGWHHSSDREIIDEGLSAFHGANRAEGSKLHDFEQAARKGHFEDGAVLVVENLDRLTRQGYEAAFEIVGSLTRHGVTVATWHDGQIYVAGERINLGNAIMLLARADLAHEESSKKSQRLKAAWASKIEAVRNGDRKALTSQMPGWLAKSSSGEIEAIPGRVAVLNEIFDWYIEGRSLPWIAAALNERKEPNWGRGRHGGKGWNVATLHKYLVNRAALGEYRPKQRAGDGNQKVSRGFVVCDFYPQVVSPAKFNRVEYLRKQRTRWTGGNQHAFRNLFKGIVSCHSCGGPVHHSSQSKPGTIKRDVNKNGTFRYSVQKVSRSYLRCQNAVRKFGCSNTKMVRYEQLEAGVLDALFLLANREHLYAPDDKTTALRDGILELERLIAAKREQMEVLLDNLMTVRSQPLAERVAKLDQAIRADESALEASTRELGIQRGAPRSTGNLKALLARRAAINCEDENVRYSARSQTNITLRAFIDSMSIDPSGEAHVIVGGNALYLHFDTAGQCTGVLYGQNTIFTGPDGEIDWNPDHPDADYKYAYED